MASHRATLERGKLIIDWQWVAGEMDDDCMREMMEYAAFNDHFIKTALDIVVKGTTEDGSWFGTSELHKMRLQLLPLLPIIARETIESAQQQLETAEAWRSKTLSEMWGKEREADNKISELRRTVSVLKDRVATLEASMTEAVSP